jgi:hypothetical protein
VECLGCLPAEGSRKEFGVNKKRRLVRIKHRKSRLRVKNRARQRRLAARKA